MVCSRYWFGPDIDTPHTQFHLLDTYPCTSLGPPEKTKTPLTPTWGIRGDISRFHSHFFLVWPLSGPSRAALPAALPDALPIPPRQVPFQPVKDPLCSLTRMVLFPFSALYKSVYYHSWAIVSSPALFSVRKKRKRCGKAPFSKKSARGPGHIPTGQHVEMQMRHTLTCLLAPLPQAPMGLPLILMLGGSRSRLRQGFALRAKHLSGAKAPPPLRGGNRLAGYQPGGQVISRPDST